MIASAPIQIIVGDAPHNPPGVEKVATSFYMKVPRNCELNKIKKQLILKYPVLQYMISVLYYLNSDGIRTTLFNHRVAGFWVHQNNVHNGTARIYVSAMMFKHPTKICRNCDDAIFGVIFTCAKCNRHSCCMKCVKGGQAQCSRDGVTFFKCEQIPMPPDVAEAMNLDQLEESRLRQMARARRRERLLHDNTVLLP